MRERRWRTFSASCQSLLVIALSSRETPHPPQRVQTADVILALSFSSR